MTTPSTPAASVPSSTTTEPSSSFVTTVPGGAFEIPPDAAHGPAALDEGHGEVIPPDEGPKAPIAVPVPDDQTPPTPEQELVAQAMEARLEQARLGLMVALGLEAQAVAEVERAEQHVAVTRSKLAGLRSEEQQTAAALERQRERVRRWAVQAYTGGSLRRLAYVLETEDINDLPRRMSLAGDAFGSLAEELGDREAFRDVVVSLRRQLVRSLSDAEQRLERSREAATEAGTLVRLRGEEVAALDAGLAVSIRGVAFPVAGPTRFSGTFGAPRMTGTRFSHAHQGTDIFAPAGTPVVAFEEGVVLRLGTDVLGGTKLWLVGQSGTRYYYAHLASYEPGLEAGQVVETGQRLALVGNTGNAVATPHHLHFEIHPDGGPAVDPYPVLLQIVEAARAGALVLAAADGGGIAGAVGLR